MYCVLLALSLPILVTSLECYSGSQLQVLDCPSISCIKQTLGVDTVRYCDGAGISSVCQTYRIFESCEMIPNLGFICCCSGNLCNSGPDTRYTVSLTSAVLFLLLRFLW